MNYTENHNTFGENTDFHLNKLANQLKKEGFEVWKNKGRTHTLAVINDEKYVFIKHSGEESLVGFYPQSRGFNNSHICKAKRVGEYDLPSSETVSKVMIDEYDSRKLNANLNDHFLKL